jgi:hypothetical protein
MYVRGGGVRAPFFQSSKGLISSTVYSKLLGAKFPKAQKDTDNLTEFLHFWQGILSVPGIAGYE